MNKSILKITKSIATIGILLTLIIWGTFKLTDRYYEKGYQAGVADSVYSCELSDICDYHKESGFRADYAHGIKYAIYTCAIETGPARIEDDFTFEGDWDRCNSNGECGPFVRNGQILKD